MNYTALYHYRGEVTKRQRPDGVIERRCSACKVWKTEDDSNFRFGEARGAYYSQCHCCANIRKSKRNRSRRRVGSEQLLTSVGNTYYRTTGQTVKQACERMHAEGTKVTRAAELLGFATTVDLREYLHTRGIACPWPKSPRNRVTLE